MKIIRKGLSFVLVLGILSTCTAAALTSPEQTLDAVISDTAAYMLQAVENPQVDPIGGEWAILGLARSGYRVNDSYFQGYYATVEAYVKGCSGVLSEKKYTEYSRVILALTAIGKDPSHVVGYNLLTPLGDYDQTIWQGVNGPIFALLALDSGKYGMPVNDKAGRQATREMYVDQILSRQLADGGFALSGTKADPGMTAMALQALSKYQDHKTVLEAIGRALLCLSTLQDGTGGFVGYEEETSESVAQAIVALGELGIALDDDRFVKNGASLLDHLLTYYVKDGGFRHRADSTGPNQMATEQAFYALVSAQRSMKGEESLYRMSDAISIPEAGGTGLVVGAGLAGKYPDVRAQATTLPGKTFEDISDPYQAGIEALASRGIINGYEGGSFRPGNTMTRAEFAAIVVRALGLTPQATDVFGDVAPSSWYASYVGTANAYGIVKGKTLSAFDPSGTITRQEAMVMAVRAARLCGLDTDMKTAEIRDALAQFDDYMKVADWAKESVAFCYREGILDSAVLAIQPAVPITRGEIAQMLFHILGKANLLS
jgi:hypothetical protein